MMITRRSVLISVGCAISLFSVPGLSSIIGRIKRVEPSMSPEDIRSMVTSGGVIFFNKGVFRVGEILVPSNCTIIGSGQLSYSRDGSWDGEGTLIIGGLNCSNAINVSIRNITIDNFDSKGNALCGMTPKTGNIIVQDVTTRANNHGQLWESNDHDPQNSNSIGNIIVKRCTHYHGPNGFVTKHKSVSFINCISYGVDVQSFVIVSDNINLKGRYSRAVNSNVVSCTAFCKKGTSALRVYSRKYNNDNSVLGVDGVNIIDFSAHGDSINSVFIGDRQEKSGIGLRSYSAINSENVYIKEEKKHSKNKMTIVITFCKKVTIDDGDDKIYMESAGAYAHRLTM